MSAGPVDLEVLDPDGVRVPCTTLTFSGSAPAGQGPAQTAKVWLGPDGVVQWDIHAGWLGSSQTFRVLRRGVPIQVGKRTISCVEVGIGALHSRKFHWREFWSRTVPGWLVRVESESGESPREPLELKDFEVK